VRFVYRDATAEHELGMRLGHPDAKVGDLAAALGSTAGVCIDGRATDPDTILTESGLVMGSVVTPADDSSRRTTTPTAEQPPVAMLRVVGGVGAGLSVPLRPGRTRLGRGGEADVQIECSAASRLHCQFDVHDDGRVDVTDLGSSNGTDLNGARLTGTARVGPEDQISVAGLVVLRVVPTSQLGPVQHVNPLREAGPGGTMPFNRAPRPAPPPGPPQVRLPEQPRRADKPPFSISAMLGPVVVAGGMVALLKDWSYALIAVLTPLMFLGNFVEERTRGRLSLRRGMRDFATDLEQAREQLTKQRDWQVRELRAASPDPAEVLYQATEPGLRLWERRPGAPDFLTVAAGIADQFWSPPVESASGELAADVRTIVAETSVLPQVPAVVDLSDGGVVGIQGDRDTALAAARAMVCEAVVTSGPADLNVAVFTDADRIGAWDWTKWLPHGADPRSGTERLAAVGAEQCEALAESLLEAARSAGHQAAQSGWDPQGKPAMPALLIVVDGVSLLEGRPCRLRDLLAGRAGAVSGIVLTTRLPALCTAVLSVDHDGTGRLERVATGDAVTGVLMHAMPRRRARELARALARFEDPEVRAEGAGLPDQINLLPLLELPETSGYAVARRWREGARSQRVGAVLGVTERELFQIDLDDDGPHGLIAGTTGSGKSELLRTMIASMAVAADPEHLTFVLVDYKGGGALDQCARLPHVVGLVTDLDEHLGERALRCLEAELRHREHALRAVGLGHIRDYQRLRSAERPELAPMPRLVVVIDEFATLVKALPDFVESLVSIAQRGRSLGMHLILATQRPSGSVSDAIKNNMKLRIALRLETAGDSQDVIDSPAAWSIGTRQWGRGFWRVSPNEVLPVQTALSTGVTPDSVARAPVTVHRFVLGAPVTERGAASDGRETDLRRIVAAANDAFAVAGFAPPRRPWPDPLPARVDLIRLGAAARALQGRASGQTAFALADDPDRQAQYTVGWDQAAGNLLVYGAVGAGTSTALAAIALAQAAASAPDRLHVFVLDLGAGDLAPLGGLPHTGAYIGATEQERQHRLIRMLRRELDERKSAGLRAGARAGWLVLIDNIGALKDESEKNVHGMARLEELTRVYADGPQVGIHIAAAADRLGAVPANWPALTPQKLLMRLADSGEYAAFDLPRVSVSEFVPGRAIVAATAQRIQIGFPGDGLENATAAAAARWSGARADAPAVGVLPQRVTVRELGAAECGRDRWTIPVGVGDDALAPVALTLYEHEHALITGPPRSGRSSALCSIARSVLASALPPRVVAFAPRRSPLRDLPAPVRVVTDYELLADALGGARADDTLVLVDDAEVVDDPAGVLDGWLATAADGNHLIAAGRPDGIRRQFGSWSQKVRASRCGVLLAPDHDLDGELLGVTLPRRGSAVPMPGRGYLVANGSVEAVQLAVSESPDAAWGRSVTS
jgi:DNA segregation ATPase FtsK/SpoIIIE, S-DNA-T family